jgi:hypothetical protein
MPRILVCLADLAVRLGRRVGRQTWPVDLAGKLGWQTWPADLAGRLGRQTWPADLTGRLGRQTWPADLAGRLGRQTWPADLAGRLGQQNGPADFAGQTSGKQPEQPLKMHPTCANLHQIFITNAKKCSWIFVLFIHKKPILVTLVTCLRVVKISCAASPQTANRLREVFEIFRWNGDCTFYVAVKIGGRFDKAFRIWR